MADEDDSFLLGGTAPAPAAAATEEEAAAALEATDGTVTLEFGDEAEVADNAIDNADLKFYNFGRPLTKDEAKKGLSKADYKEWKKRFGGGGGDGDEGVAASAAAAVGSSSGDAAGVGDDDSKFMVDGRSMTKKEAKKALSKADYKQWKRRFGGGGDDGDGDDDDDEKSSKKKKKKDKDGKKDKKKSSKDSKRSKKKRDADDSDDGDAAEGDDAPPKQRKRREATKAKERLQAQGRRTKASAGAGAAAAGAALQGLTLQQPGDALAAAGAGKKRAVVTMTVERKKQLAADTVKLMREARIADAAARANNEPPTHRLGIIGEVQTVLRREMLHEDLVAAGVLEELAYWLFDPTRNPPELAPLDLRTAALDCLLRFELEGADNLGNAARRGPTRRRGKNGDEDIDVFVGYEGIDAETLRKSEIGRAVNFVRRHPNELNVNKNKAVALLQNLSRTFEGHEHNRKRRVLWPCINDRDVASPFDPVRTASDVFASSINRIDPKDPSSYMRVPPKRIPKSYITTLYLDNDQLITRNSKE